MTPPGWDIALERESEVPLGVQLAWAVRGRILTGELGAGGRLPGVRELAARAGVHVNTVRAVYARLEAEGLIASIHGRGTFVSDVAVSDPRLVTVVQRALADAEAEGLDPRDVGAALYAGAGAASPEPTPAAQRRRLRGEIAALERELAERRHVVALAAYAEGETRQAPAGDARVLDAAALRSQRDELAAQVQLLREAGASDLSPPRPETAPAPAAASRATSSTRARRGAVIRWTPTFGT